MSGLSKKILVTGGSGFIGGNLVKELRRLGHYVVTMDFKSSDYPCDISDYNNFNPIDEKIDVIYHLAGQSYGRGGLIDPHKDLEWNAQGTLNVSLFAKERDVRKVIYTSTMAVYGDGDWSKESDMPNPLSNYGVSKLTGEYYLKHLTQYDVDYTIFRLFNTYGPGQDIHHMMKGIVSALLSQVIDGHTINVTGSLSRYRDLTYVDDCVEALIMGMNDELSNNTYNICSKRKTTVMELIDIIIEASGQDKKWFAVKDIGGHDGDQFGNTGDNLKLVSVGWKPRIPLEDGIKLFYDHVRDNVI